MAQNPRKERLLKELKETRDELVKEAQKIAPEEFDWRPRPDMENRTARGLLREIGVMEKICATWLINGKTLDWGELWSEMARKDETPEGALEELRKIRQETLQFLETISDADLDAMRPVPRDWEQYWGPSVAMEVALHWIGRHEYYHLHLGQLIYNRWLLGHNPYKE